MRFFKRSFPILILLTVFFTSHIFAQKRSDPTFLSGVVHLSKYIASNEFVKLKKTNNDSALVDTLYIKTIQYFEGDKSEALLCLTFALLPFNKMTIQLPIFKIPITFPLPSASEKLFRKKLVNQPKNIFCDSPKDNFGDKDKLSHFFGNAFLAYNISFFNLSKFMGIFVEMFEATLKVQGSVDHRDIIANNLGELFGKSLKINENLMPSKALSIYSLLFLRVSL